MKKHRKPRSQPHKRKSRVAPLPLDTSRDRRPATAKATAKAPRPAPRRNPSPARRSSPARAILAHVIARTSRLDRADAAMLALPVLLIALTIAVGRWSNDDRALTNVAGLTPGAKHALAGLPPVATPVTPSSQVAPVEILNLMPAQVQAATAAMAEVAPVFPAPVALTAASVDPHVQPPANPQPETVDPATPQIAAALPDPSFENSTAHAASPADTVTAHVFAPPAPLQPTAAHPTAAAAILPPDRTAPAWDLPGGEAALATGLSQCRFEPALPRTPLPVSLTPGDSESFGLALAAAARRQLEQFVIYNDRYTRLKYPMGDVHPMYGVCTDVVIRAYRELGVDLQELVQKTKSGSGDPNIDHRRVDTLRKFFSRFGESRPASTFAEDYKPGDIVTYWRPQNRHSRTHIAIVSDVTGPSGRPLIIHNRGWGPQQEDGLFVDEITGHYRFSGLKGSAIEARNAGPRQTKVAPSPSPQDRTKGTGAGKGTDRPVVRTGL